MGGNGASYQAARGLLGSFGIGRRTANNKAIRAAFNQIEHITPSGKSGIIVKDGKLKMSRATNELLSDLADKLSRDMYVEDKSAAADYKDIKSFIAGSKYYFSKMDRSSISDFSAYNKREGILRVTLDKGARSVDSLYHELAEQYPGYFPHNAGAPSDELARINNVLHSLKNNSIPLSRSERAEVKRDLWSSLANAYYTAKLKNKRS